MRATSRQRPGAFGAQIVAGNLGLRVIEVERDWKDSGFLYFEAHDNYQFIRIKIEATNLGTNDSTVKVEDDNFRGRGTRVFPYGFFGNGNPFSFGPSRSPFDHTIKAGESVIGNFITEISDDASNLRLEFAASLDEPAIAFLSLE